MTMINVRKCTFRRKASMYRKMVMVEEGSQTGLIEKVTSEQMEGSEGRASSYCGIQEGKYVWLSGRRCRRAECWSRTGDREELKQARTRGQRDKTVCKTVLLSTLQTALTICTHILSKTGSQG